MKTYKKLMEEIFLLPDYPMQVSQEKDDGNWVTGDPTKPIEGFEDGDVNKVIDQANQQVKKDRK